MVNFDYSQFLSLLDKQYGYYQAIYNSTKEENDLFTRKRPVEEIAGVLKKKKILMACMDEINKSLKPFKDGWQELSHQQEDNETSSAIKQRLKELDEILRHILQLDNANQQMMQKLLLSLKEQGERVNAR